MKPRYAKLAFACVCIAQVVWVGLGLSTLSLYANPITAEWGILRSQFMLTVTLAIVADTVVGSFFFGPLLDFIGTRWTFPPDGLRRQRGMPGTVRTAVPARGRIPEKGRLRPRLAGRAFRMA